MTMAFVDDGTERTLNLSDTSTNTLYVTNWTGLSGMTTTLADNNKDILISNGGEYKFRIKDAFVSERKLTISDGSMTERTLKDCMTEAHIYINGDEEVKGTNDGDCIRVIKSEGCSEGGNAVGEEGSDYIAVDRNGVTVATNNLASSLAARQDLADGIMEGVTLYGEDYHVYAQSKFNDIYSLNKDSDDSYYTYFMNSGNNQTTRIEDAGGTDSLTLLNSYAVAMETEDGQYKVSGALNTNLFFRVDPNAYSDFDVEIGTIGNMENAAQGNDHVGIFIKNNQVESISTSDGYSITSVQLETIAEQAAGWLTDKGFSTYDDMLKSTGGEDLAKDYVSFINTKAQDFWQAPTTP